MNTLKGKISFIYIGLVFLIAVVGFLGFINLYRMQTALESLMTANYKSINAVTNMLETIEQQNSAMLIYANMDKQAGIELFSMNNINFLKWYQVEAGNITEPGEGKLVDSLNSDYRSYVKLFYQFQETENSATGESRTLFYNNEISPVFNDITKTLQELIIINQNGMQKSRLSASQNTKRSMYILLFITLASVITGYILSHYFVKRFLSPLQKLSESISRVREGDLNQQIVIDCGDEIGMLAKEFNEMIKRLENYEKSTLGTLMAEKTKTMAVVKSISDPLLVLDANYRLMLINDACESFFDISENNILGKHFLEVIMNGEVFDHISRTVESGLENNEKIILIKKDSDFYFNVVVTAINDASSHNTGLIAVLHDVTELKELERVKTDFIATISHEFKTPLTSVMMAASMLAEGAMGELNNEQLETLDALKDDSEKLSELVNELLELSRIESGKAVYDLRPCSVNAIVDKSIKGFLEIAEKKEIIISNKLEIEYPFVYADFDKICWVINNLISNAIKYTNAGDLIEISAKLIKNEVHISVKDTGKGIPSAYIDRIFDKFVQVRGWDIEERGTGLGLSVAKEIVKSHRGNIWVKSELDAGSKFTFSLPVYKEL